jgi:hypothetical protein
MAVHHKHFCAPFLSVLLDKLLPLPCLPVHLIHVPASDFACLSVPCLSADVQGLPGGPPGGLGSLGWTGLVARSLRLLVNCRTARPS